LSQLRDSLGVQRCRTRSKFATGVFPEVVHGHKTQIDFSESERSTIHGGLAVVVDAINEYAHPLVASAVRIDRAASLARRLDLDAR